MSESKGRTGKKPKYQIADIGGADLTSEDISTERVLNFLIKGDLGTVAENVPPTVHNRKPEPPLPSLSESRSSTLPEIPETPDAGNQPIKRSLSHLFERAGGGSTPAASKEAYVKSFESERTTPIVNVSSSGSQPIDHEAFLESVVVEPPHVGIGPERDALSANPQTEVIESEIKSGPLVRPQTRSDSLPVSTEIESQLTEFVERWKNLYRLKPGEIAALSNMFRMAYGGSHSECYVKMHNLAEISALDYRYCQKVVRSLERLGWITKLQDYDPTTQQGVLYRVNLRPLHLT